MQQRAYKANKRHEKINHSNIETQKTVLQPIEQLKAKEFLTVKEVSQLLSISIRSTYTLIENETIKSINMGQRMTRVSRTEINKIFKQQ